MSSDPLTNELENLLGFELWLSSWRPIAVVGQSRHSCQCPLACYLMQAFNATAIVGSSRIAVGDIFTPHTELTKALTLCIDDARGSHEPITARQTKTALAAARRLVNATQKEQR